MAMKIIYTSLLVVFMLFCLANAQFKQPSQQFNPPQVSRYPVISQQYPVYQPPKIPSPPHHPQPPPPPPPPRQSPLKKDRSSTCEVAVQDRQRCGPSDITPSACLAMHCCVDGPLCYYGKYVNVQCTKDAQFILVIYRDATLPSIDLDSITFLEGDEACKPVSKNSAFVIYQFHVKNCGTVVLEESGSIIYENRMSSLYEVAVGDRGAITRDSSFELLFRCKYRKHSDDESVNVEVIELLSPEPIAAIGPLHVELRLANGRCIVKGCVEEEVAYNSFYADAEYPVTVVLRDPVYVEIRIQERTDPNLALTLGRCWANTSPQPDALPQWHLLIDGCPYRDDNYQTQLVPVGRGELTYPAHHRRFIFKMFTFVSQNNPSNVGTADAVEMTPLREKVYIHCETALCQLTDQNSCEPRCLRTRRQVAASEQKGPTPESTVVSSLEIVIVDLGLNSQ